MTIQPLYAPPSATNINIGGYAEYDVLEPGRATINFDRVLYFYPDQNGMAILVFGEGVRLGLSVTYLELATGVLGRMPTPTTPVTP